MAYYINGKKVSQAEFQSRRSLAQTESQKRWQQQKVRSGGRAREVKRVMTEREKQESELLIKQREALRLSEEVKSKLEAQRI